MGEGTTARRAWIALGALLIAGCGDAVARVVSLGPSTDAAAEGGADAGRGDAPTNGSDAADSAPMDAAVDVPGCVAEVEPNGMPAQAQHITKGTTCGMIRAFGDIDYYEFDFATNGTNFTFAFDGDSSLQLLITAPGGGGTDTLTPPASTLDYCPPPPRVRSRRTRGRRSSTRRRCTGSSRGRPCCFLPPGCTR
jgi:hypothetical protein